MSTFRFKYSYPIFTLIYIGFIAYQPTYANLMAKKDSKIPVVESLSIYITVTTCCTMFGFLIAYFLQGTMIIAKIYHFLSE